jgi:hypothetical protein
MISLYIWEGRLAQLEERLVRNEEAAGSSPAPSTKRTTAAKLEGQLNMRLGRNASNSSLDTVQPEKKPVENQIHRD